MRAVLLLGVGLAVSGCNAKIESSAATRKKSTVEPVKDPEPEAKALKLSASDCKDPDLSKVMAGETLMLCNGTMASGTHAPDSPSVMPPTCTEDGQSGCIVADPGFKAVASANLLPGDIRSGKTLAGVTGTMVEAPAACAVDGATGCMATAAFPAADAAQVMPSNIRLGATIAGRHGIYDKNLLAWYSAETEVYKVADTQHALNGEFVAQWKDRSGNGLNLTNWRALKPTVDDTCIGGRPAIKFDPDLANSGSGSPLGTSVGIGQTPMTAFAVALQPPGQTITWDALFSTAAAGGGNSAHGFMGLIGNGTGFGPSFGDGLSFTYPATPQVGAPFILYGTDPAPDQNSDFAVGTTNDGWLGTSACVSEVLIFSRILDADERAGVVSYLRGKYGF